MIDPRTVKKLELPFLWKYGKLTAPAMTYVNLSISFSRFLCLLREKQRKTFSV
jgi:hypothetical protein